MSKDSNQVKVEDLGSLHNYRTEIPNIVFMLGLDPYELAAYCILKRTAGDQRACFKSNATLCEEIGCKETKLKEIKKSLSSPRKALRGLPLIRVKKRKTKQGDSDTDLIQIVDIWAVNMDVIGNSKQIEKEEVKVGKNPEKSGEGWVAKRPRVGRQTTQGGSPNDPKEINSEEDHIEEVSDIGKSPSSKNSSHSLPSLTSLPSLPFSMKRKKQQDWTSSLSPEEKQFHDELLAFEPPLGEKIESSTVTAFLKKYGLEKTKQAFIFYTQRIEKGKKKAEVMPRSIGAVMRDALKNNRKPIDETYEKNKQYALNLKSFCNQLVITEKYVSIPEMSWDLSLFEKHKQFQIQLFEKCKWLRERAI